MVVDLWGRISESAGVGTVEVDRCRVPLSRQVEAWDISKVIDLVIEQLPTYVYSLDVRALNIQLFRSMICAAGISEYSRAFQSAG